MSQKFKPVAKNDVKAVFVKAARYKKNSGKWVLDTSDTFYLNMAGVDYIYGTTDVNARYGSEEFARISERNITLVKEQLLSRGIELVDLDAEAAEMEKPPPKSKLKPAL